MLTEKLRLSLHLTGVLDHPDTNRASSRTCCRPSGSRRRSRETRRRGACLHHRARSSFGGSAHRCRFSRQRRGLQAQDVKITDPRSVVMIVNRDSNDIGFMDIKSKKMIGKTFLGNNVNPHMVMMSPDGRYVVTGGTRANKAFIIDTRTLQLVKVYSDRHRAGTPGVLARQPLVLPGNPDGDSISVIDMQSLTKIKTIPGFVGAAQRDLPP